MRFISRDNNSSRPLRLPEFPIKGCRDRPILSTGQDWKTDSPVSLRFGAAAGPIDTRMIYARFCLMSLLLLMLAVGVHGGALRDWSRNASIRAQAVSATQEQRTRMRAEADRFSHRGSVLHVVGISLAAAGAASLIASFRRREPARWRAVPVALLVSYVIFQFVMA
jgi:hypothetical protein